MSTVCRILLVDDSPDDLAHLRQMLLCGSTRSYEFTEAALGREALACVAQQKTRPFDGFADCSSKSEMAHMRQAPHAKPFDCILLDFNLPDMNAIDVLARLCAGADGPPCPVVVITGWSGMDKSDGHNLIRAGAQDYIGKSWTTPESLSRAIENSMERFELQTRRRAIEAELSDSEERYRSLFTSMSDCLCLLERVAAQAGEPSDFRYIALNPAFMAQTLIPGVVGQTIRQTVLEEPAKWIAQFEQVRTTGTALRQERPLNAGERVLDVHAFCMGAPGSSQIAVVFKDITERKRAEHQLAAHAQALTDLDRRKDEFLAMLSHELRNPLAPISNAVQLLRLRPDDDPVRQKAHAVIARQAGQLNHLVDELLEISRISTGRVQLKREQVALGSIVARAIETTQPLMAQARHVLAVSVPSEPVWLHADALRMEQVVVNLLTNAAKYTDQGGQLRLEVQQHGDIAEVRIADNGIGIASELLPRIFDLFAQAERSLDRSQGGLGIGLCLVKRLVELHGGSVSAHSTLGQGSEFVVRLPAMQPDLAAELTVTDTEQCKVQLASALRVLVVDDNVDAATSMMELLQRSAHAVQLAHDGPSAIAAAGAWQPDMVLLDIGLPGFNGYEVARRLRQNEQLGHTMLIAVTGYGQESDRQLSQAAGFDYHLTKPADYTELEKLIQLAAHAALARALGAVGDPPRARR